MDKNKIVIFMIIIVTVCITSYMLIANKNKKHNDNSQKENLEYTVISEKYSNIQTQIISTYTEYLNFLFDIEQKGNNYNIDKNKYNEKFFEEKSIAIINVRIGTGMNKLKNMEFTKEDNALKCNIDIEYTKSQTVTDDMTGRLVLVEIDKYITEIKF